MPSEMKQLNMRVDDETHLRLERLQAAMSAALGAKVKVVQVVSAALIELEKRYPIEAPRKSEAPEVKPAAKGRKRKG